MISFDGYIFWTILCGFYTYLSRILYQLWNDSQQYHNKYVGFLTSTKKKLYLFCIVYGLEVLSLWDIQFSGKIDIFFFILLSISVSAFPFLISSQLCFFLKWRLYIFQILFISHRYSREAGVGYVFRKLHVLFVSVLASAFCFIQYFLWITINWKSKWKQKVVFALFSANNKNIL